MADLLATGAWHVAQVVGGLVYVAGKGLIHLASGGGSSVAHAAKATASGLTHTAKTIPAALPHLPHGASAHLPTNVAVHAISTPARLTGDILTNRATFETIRLLDNLNDILFLSGYRGNSTYKPTMQIDPSHQFPKVGALNGDDLKKEYENNIQLINKLIADQKTLLQDPKQRAAAGYLEKINKVNFAIQGLLSRNAEIVNHCIKEFTPEKIKASRDKSAKLSTETLRQQRRVIINGNEAFYQHIKNNDAKNLDLITRNLNALTQTPALPAKAAHTKSTPATPAKPNTMSTQQFTGRLSDATQHLQHLKNQPPVNAKPSQTQLKQAPAATNPQYHLDKNKQPSPLTPAVPVAPTAPTAPIAPTASINQTIAIKSSDKLTTEQYRQISLAAEKDLLAKVRLASQPANQGNSELSKYKNVTVIESVSNNNTQLVVGIPRNDHTANLDTMKVSHNQNQSLQIELSSANNQWPSDNSMLLMLEPYKNIPLQGAGLVMEYVGDPLVTLRMFEAIKLSDQEGKFSLHSKDIEALRKDPKLGAHFEAIENFSSDKFKELVANHTNSTGNPRPLGDTTLNIPKKGLNLN